YHSDMLIRQREVSRDTALAWLSLYEAEHAAVLEQSLQHECENTIASAEISYRAGKGTQADIWKAEDAFNTSRGREIELRNKAENARADLQRWIGDKDFALEEKIDIKDPPSLDDLI